MAPAVTEERVDSQAIDWTLPFVVGNDEAEALLGSIVSDDILAKESKEATSAFLVSEERRHPSKGKGKTPFVDESLKCKVAEAIKGVFKMPPGSFLGALQASLGACEQPKSDKKCLL